MRPTIPQTDLNRSITYYKLANEPSKLIFSPETQSLFLFCFVWISANTSECICVCPLASIPALYFLSFAGMSNLRPTGHMWPRMAMNAAQHKITNLLKILFFAHQCSLVFVYLMCGPRQLSQCDPEMPKGWTFLTEFKQLLDIWSISTF